MPRYFFNVYDDHVSIDTVGLELAGHKEARRAAVRSCGVIIESEGEKFRFDEDWRMEVVDETGLILFRLDFSVMDSPAVSNRVSTTV